MARQHLIAPDALEKNHRQATFEFMDDRLTLKDKNVLQNLAKRGLKVEKSVPVHGVIEPFEQMVKNIKSKPS